MAIADAMRMIEVEARVDALSGLEGSVPRRSLREISTMLWTPIADATTRGRKHPRRRVNRRSGHEHHDDQRRAKAAAGRCRRAAGRRDPRPVEPDRHKARLRLG